MDQYKPHSKAAFEGHYSKFDLPSGARLAVIICTIPSAPKKPHMISFTYVPQDTSKIYQREIMVPEMTFSSSSESHSPVEWRQDFPGGQVICYDNETTDYTIENEHFSFTAKTRSRRPWMQDMDTPEGLLVHLPLPLHWHVHSLCSIVDFNLKIHDHNMPQEDVHGTCMVHLEKNWAHSFPTAHIWVQARSANDKTSICLAGGQILGLEAYLVGYRSEDGKCDAEYRPPFAVSLAGFSPTMTATPDWSSRTFTLTVRAWRRQLVVRAKAAEGTFFGLSSPFPEGHRENFLGQSFEADVEVEVWESEAWLFGGWKKVHEERFERGSLEFGGAYYGEAGGEKRRN